MMSFLWSMAVVQVGQCFACCCVCWPRLRRSTLRRLSGFLAHKSIGLLDRGRQVGGSG